MKQQCRLCGRITDNWICKKCFEERKGKSLREFFHEDEHLINLLTRDCLTCPLKNTEFCDMPFANPQSEEEERLLCQKYVKKWLDYHEEHQFLLGGNKNE